MKSFIASILFTFLTLTAFAQCSETAIQVSSATETSVQLYHAGFFLIPSGFDNVCDWEVRDFDDNIIHEATTSGAWGDQSFMLFNHSIPTTDSMKVSLVIVNETSGITCTMNDTLIYSGPIIEWEILSSNGGSETTVLGINEIDASSVSCFEGSDGSSTVEGLNGNAPYTFSIDGGPFGDSPVFNNLNVGEHTITVSDADGSLASIMVTTFGPTEIILGTSSTDVECFGGNEGEIIASAVGGVVVDNYDFFINGAGPSLSGVFSNLVAGIYEISVVDANDCVITETVEVFQSDQITVESIMVSTPDCFSGTNGSIDFDVAGGEGNYSFVLDGQSPSSSLPITGLMAGTYTMTVLDQNDCATEFDFEISDPLELELEINSIENTGCQEAFTGIIDVSGVGGTSDYEYMLGSISNTTGIFDSLSAGDYMVSIQDANGCALDSMITIEVDAPFEVSYDIVSPDCSGDSTGVISIAIDGGTDGFVFYLNGVEITSSTISSLTAGTYQVTVEDEDGCSIDETAIVEAAPMLVVETMLVQNVDCSTGTEGGINIIASGGDGNFSYSLNEMTNTSGEFTGLDEGTYTVTVTDGLGCSTEVELTILQEGQIDALVEDIQDISCNGMMDGIINISIEGSMIEHEYQLNGMTNTTGSFSDLAAGSYSATITNALSCSVELAFTIEEPEELALDLVEFVGDDGSGNGSITVEGSGGTSPYQYSIDGGISFQSEPMFSGLTNDEYIITILDVNNCETTLNIIVTNTNDIEIDARINIFPSPVSAGKDVNITSKYVIESVVVVDAVGQLLHTSTSNLNQTTINTNAFSKGTFLFGIKTKQGMTWKKVMVVK